MITDALVHAPVPVAAPPRGGSYIDPVFNEKITRLTDEYPRASGSDLYAKNGFWNADGSRMWHNSPDGAVIIDTTSGEVIRTNVPGNYDVSFDPVNPDTLYYFDGSELRRYDVATGLTHEVKAFNRMLGRLGGSLDWISVDARYMILNHGGQGRVWDRQERALYAGSIPGDTSTGWLAISPDARYVVAVVEEYIPGVGQPIHSYAIDHGARRLSTSGVMFWSLGGDHGDLVSVGGTTWLVTKESHSEPGIWAVDVSLPQSPTNLAKQRADNRKLLPLAWADIDGHISCGGLWAYVSVESTDLSTWRPYKDEIVRIHVVTGEVQRLAHHRSQGDMTGSANYRRQPRVCASWDGSRVAWASNFGADAEGYADIYAMTLGATVEPPVEPPPPDPPAGVKHDVEIRVDVLVDGKREGSRRKIKFTV